MVMENTEGLDEKQNCKLSLTKYLVRIVFADMCTRGYDLDVRQAPRLIIQKAHC